MRASEVMTRSPHRPALAAFNANPNNSLITPRPAKRPAPSGAKARGGLTT